MVSEDPYAAKFALFTPTCMRFLFHTQYNVTVLNECSFGLSSWCTLSWDYVKGLYDVNPSFRCLRTTWLCIRRGTKMWYKTGRRTPQLMAKYLQWRKLEEVRYTLWVFFCPFLQFVLLYFSPIIRYWEYIMITQITLQKKLLSFLEATSTEEGRFKVACPRKELECWMTAIRTHVWQASMDYEAVSL